MSQEKRYIPTKALQVKDSEFVPYWKLKHQYHKDYGEGFIIENDYKINYNNLVDCYWDTKDHKLILGIVKDVYPEKTSYYEEEDVFIEVDHSTYKEDKIQKIFYEEYESKIHKISSLIKHNELRWYFTKEEQKNLDINAIYEIRLWKPYYILYSGEIIKWDYKLKHKYKDDKSIK
jgi:hypothetical protein